MGSRATARSSAAAALLSCVLGAAPAARACPATLGQSSQIPTTPAVRIERAPAGWETLATGLPEETRLRLIPAFRYNRVDGAVPGFGAAFRSEREAAPFLYAGAAYATGRDRFLAAAGFEVPIGDPTRIRIGADVYRQTASEDVWIVGELENTLFALFARTDYRDYYEATGGIGRIIWQPGRDASLEAALRIQHESSLSTRVRFSVCGKEDRFRASPPVEPGDEALVVVSARLGPYRLPAPGGSFGTIAYERAGGPLGRDFDYGRARVSARMLHRFAPRVFVRARATGGSTREGRLPPQKVWHVGGISTLRGHDYKSFSGDQFFVANGEYLVRVRKNLFPFAFLDWGAAWFGARNLDRQRPGLDGGIGLRVAEDALSVTVARDLRRSGAPLRVGVRLGGGF